MFSFAVYLVDKINIINTINIIIKKGPYLLVYNSEKFRQNMEVENGAVDLYTNW